ncbi:MAG TPA: carbohydrate-binding protein, partial [Prolixibacteraceae bacterium]|nr:carbohydrate-binding protein [Prolixibacteraceae bacterium]
EYKGMIVDASELTRGNHPGIIEFKGKSYCFGHSYDMLKKTTSKFYERRSVDMDEMVYNADGTIQNRKYWSVEGPTQVGIFNPFKRVEAETMAWSEGLKTNFETEWEGPFEWNRGKKIADRLYVTSIHNGDYILVQGVDFAQGAKSVEAMVSPLYGGKIEIHTDKIDGPVIATVNVTTSGEGDIWKTNSAPVSNVQGVHDIYFVFRGEKDLFNFDWWQFSK